MGKSLDKMEKEIKELKDKGSLTENAIKEMNVDIEKIREDKEYREGVVAEFKLDLDKVKLNWNDLEANFNDLRKDIVDQQYLVFGLVKEKEELLNKDTELALIVKGLMDSIKDLAEQLSEVRGKYIDKLVNPEIDKDDVDSALKYLELNFSINDIRERFILLVTSSVADVISRLKEVGVENGK